MADKKKKVTITTKKGKTDGKSKKSRKKERFGLDVPDELADRGREIWLAGLGALSTVEEEGMRLFRSLVERGEAWEKSGRETVGAARKMMDEARGRMGATVENVAKRGGGGLADLDETIMANVERSVEQVLKRFNVPSRSEVRDLSAKVERLSAQVAALASTLTETERVAYNVVPHDDGWAVQKEGVDRAASVHGTKTEAVEAGRSLAKEHAPARLVVHKQDGTIQDTFSYD